MKDVKRVKFGEDSKGNCLLCKKPIERNRDGKVISVRAGELISLINHHDQPDYYCKCNKDK